MPTATTRSYCCFTLYGPLASFGDIAVGEVRGSWARPSRTAVLGLLAACLGIDRTDEAGHDALNAACRLAIRVDLSGVLLRDYHTTQAPGEKRGRHYFTRRDELFAMIPQEDRYSDINTILSRRDHLQDACFTVCCWTEEAATPYTTVNFRDALNAPHYAPYLGRKALVAALPFGPELIEADSPLDALAAFPHPSMLDGLVRKHGRGDVEVEIWLDRADVPASHAHLVRAEHVRRDALESRARWTFRERAEVVLAAPPPSRTPRQAATGGTPCT